MKSVVIIGGGPSGLVAAKTLLHTYPGRFEVTILEKKDRVGGMWALSPGDDTGIVSPEMPTNLSRFTVAFSDLAWDSVDLSGVCSSKQLADSLPMFPKAWQVGRYLEAYAEKYIPKDVIQFGTQVIRAERFEVNGERGWKLQWTTASRRPAASSPEEESRTGALINGTDKATPSEGLFDYLIAASGFFSSPRALNLSLPNTASAPLPCKIIHSSHLRTLRDLLPDGQTSRGNIVVIGGSMSGVEAAASAALQLADSEYSPFSSECLGHRKIYHVSPRPFYVLPRYLPKNPREKGGQSWTTAPSFIPLDLCLYDLGRRPDGSILPMNGLVSPEKASKTHAFLQSVIGGDQGNLGSSAIVHTEQETRSPPYVTISETYDEFVRSGSIIPVRGRVVSVGHCTKPARENQSAGKVEVMTADGTTTIDDVVSIIHATGFTPQSAIEWMDDKLKDSMGREPASHRLPLLLQQHSTYHNDIPNLAFVGFYEGPYWGVMEMQARHIARKWSGNADSLSQTSREELTKQCQEMQELRDAMLQRRSDVPQFWMGDYMGLMEGLSADLGVHRNDTGWDGRRGPSLPARYTTSPDDQQQADLTLGDLHETLHAATDGSKFVAAAAFRAMQGRWTLRRKLESFLPGFPSGAFEGSATFHPRFPTSPDFDAEYLYVEEGTLVTDGGLTLNANKRYVYRYSEATDRLSTWFVKEDGKTVDYLFNDMEFQRPPDKEQHRGWIAKGFHHCTPDDYDSLCEFRFRGAALERFRIRYVVKGPKKDYISDTSYER